MSPQAIAHYRLINKLGAGGMGEVWRATDTKLGREVAIKVLPANFAQDSERMARFEREAKVLASLNRPHIAQIYGIEERSLIMELVEGETLKGPLPLDTALDYARQISAALEAAHDKGIVHRDLKPGNIMITPAGVVKVLDFGLALTEPRPQGAVADSPTVTISPTRAGVILGTAPYMSPEQARGKTVDKRADIWAFGCVLYEMLTGQPAFSGETTTDILAEVVRKEPDLTRVPPQVRRLLRRCLEKDPKKRLRDIGDAWDLLDDKPGPAATVRKRSIVPFIAAAAFAAIAAVLGFALWRATRPVDHPLVRLSVDLGPEAVAGDRTTVVISPDGSRIVFPARGPDGKQVLATRLLIQTQNVFLAGTEGGSDPFFSSGGQWIGFFADARLKKVSVQGGAVVTLCDIPTGSARGASWGEDGNIILTISGNPGYGLSRVPEAGGKLETVTKPGDDGEATHRWPQILPGGKFVLFTGNTVNADYDNANIEILSVKTRSIKTLVRGGHFGRYLPSGYLVYLRQGTLFGAPLDLNRLEVGGTPVPLVDEVAGIFGSGQFDFSRNGTFVYSPGKSEAASFTIAWLGNDGNTQPLLNTLGSNPRVSPDGQHLAFDSGTGLQIYDLERGTAARIPSTASAIYSPVWTPDGKHIAFSSASKAGMALEWVRSDSGGEPQRVLESKNELTPYSFSPDGKRLAFTESDPQTIGDLWLVSLDTSDPDHPKAGKPEPLLRSQFDEREPALSPDGHWMAYTSNESGQFQIYVRPVTPTGSLETNKWQVSTVGGIHPVWSNRELFFAALAPDNRLMAAAYSVKGDSFVAAKPYVWSNVRLAYAGWPGSFDISPDGKRASTTALLPAHKALFTSPSF